jgi:hypothetical protein
MNTNKFISDVPIKNISKIKFHDILYNNKKTTNLTKILKKKNSISRASLKNLSMNYQKKNYSSSIDYNYTSLKKNMNFSLSNINQGPSLSNISISFKPKEIIPKSTKFFEINNYCFKNDNEENNFFSKIEFNKNKKIKNISMNLENSLSQLNIDEDNEDNILLIYKKLLTYLSALDNYIKLISSIEEKNLLSEIKEGIDKLFNIMGKINQNLLIENLKFKKENEKKNSIKIDKIKLDGNNTIKQKFIQYQQYSKIDKDSKKDSFNIKNNEKEDLIDDSNISYSELDSIRFNDKIKMKKISSYESIPKLNLKFYNTMSNKNLLGLKGKNHPKYKSNKIIFNHFP